MRKGAGRLAPFFRLTIQIYEIQNRSANFCSFQNRMVLLNCLKSVIMLPDKRLNIYPKTDENIQAMIDYYFVHFNVNQENAIKKMKERTSLSLNQLEFIIKKLSEAFVPIFTKHLVGRIRLTNLFSYGVEALEEGIINKHGSKSRQMITQKFKDFVMQSPL